MEKVGEAELLAAARAGQELDCADGAGRRPVAAELLRRCCHQLKDQIDPRGLRLRRASIAGSLDLAGLDVPFPVRFDDCDFDAPLVAEGAHLRELSLTRCARLPGLLGNGLQVRRDLDLSGSELAGAHRTTVSAANPAAVWLCESSIGGRLLCVDTVIDAGGGRAIHADRIHVGGIVRLHHQFTARGQIRLLGAQLDGSLDLAGALIEVPGGAALDLDHAVIGGSLLLIDDPAGRHPVIRGRIAMGSARITAQFLIRNARLAEMAAAPPPGSGYAQSRIRGTALSAPRLSVGAEMTMEGSCQVFGGVDLSMSELSSLYIGPGCSLHAPGRTALDLTNAELLSTLTVGDQVPVAGTVRLSGTRIHGNLCLRGASLSAPEGKSLVAAQGAVVDGGTELQDLRATGGRLRFSNANLGNLVAVGAQLVNPTGSTLYLHHATVRGSVILVGGFTSQGLLTLSRSTVEGRLECGGGSFTCPAPAERNEHGHAIEAISAVIRGGMYLDWVAVSPSVDFTNASTPFLMDDPGNWPPSFVISGFTYDRFEQPQGSAAARTWDHAARCAWLSHQAAYDAGPYEQAARVFREHGYTAGAEEILIAQRKHARRAMTGPGALLRRAVDVAYSTTVGYGYRPRRVLWLLAALLIMVIVSLEIPAAQATMRATTSAGAVYSTHGPVGGSTAGNALVPGLPPHSDACGDGQIRCFNPVLYAIDTVIPLVSLDQRSTWYPDPHVRDGAFMQGWLNAATLLGWLLSSIFVLSLARLSRST